MNILSKSEAQNRADQIRSFQSELTHLKQGQIIAISAEQETAIEGYHNNLLHELSITFDIDANNREKQLSLGMKIASFLGALGFSASVFFLFYQFWGLFSTNLQLVILIGAPFICLLATYLIADRENTGYYTKIIGLVSLSCFFLDLVMIGQIYNITPSPDAFAILALFSFLLAYATNSRLLLAAAIVSLASFMSAKIGTWCGIYWLNFGQRPENFLPVSCLLLFIPLIPHTKHSEFDVIYRVFALLFFFIPVLIISHWGAISYLPLENNIIENSYQIIGFFVSGLAIWLGVKKQLTEVVNTANGFFVTFLYTKFYSWWWDWMPKYLFFLVIALTAILILIVFKRLRNAGQLEIAS